jgi:hypothetical protein
VKDKPSYESRVPTRFRPASPGRSRSRRAQGASTSSLLLDEGFVQTHGTTLSFLGLTLGAFVSRKFLVVPFAVAVTYAMDAVRSVMTSTPRRSRRR